MKLTEGKHYKELDILLTENSVPGHVLSQCHCNGLVERERERERNITLLFLMLRQELHSVDQPPGLLSHLVLNDVT